MSVFSYLTFHLGSTGGDYLGVVGRWQVGIRFGGKWGWWGFSDLVMHGGGVWFVIFFRLCVLGVIILVKIGIKR